MGKAKVGRICEVCTVKFEADKWVVENRGGGRFCSRECQNQWQTIPLEVRFKKYIGPITESGCILWVGAIDEDGYGIIGRGGQGNGCEKAHRLSYKYTYGEIPDGLMVLHSCDNPPCINVEHLFLGDHGDNTDDMVAKGRQAYGERHGMAKINEEIVREVRRRHAEERSRDQLALDLGIHRSLVDSALNPNNWKHVE